MTTDDKNIADQGKKKDYEIGYGKPPKAHQWKKGQSGNPLGYRHPKTKKQFESLLDDVFSEEISAKLPGKTKKQKMARLKAAVIKAIDSGNIHGLEYFIDRRYGKIPSSVDVTMPAIFQQINLEVLPLELLDKISKGDVSVVAELIGIVGKQVRDVVEGEEVKQLGEGDNNESTADE